MAYVAEEHAEIANVSMGRPHVVILGAGASLAAFPNGDRHGRKLPLMSNIVAVVGLAPILEEAGVEHGSVDFEVLYSRLATSGRHDDCVQQLEQAVFGYFSDLELPDEPTLYDHLVLSLREKDVIATFNWDPFLWQALARNCGQARLATALFLHGNVAVGHCMAHKAACIGHQGERCWRCGKPLGTSPLLYPVAQKDYNEDPFTKKNWELLQACLRDAFMLTIFGYSAPVTDVAAVGLMKQGWGSPAQRNLEEIEIIDIKDEDELRRTWEPFIHSHHYGVFKSFYESCIGNHPRRSCEAAWAGLMDRTLYPKRRIPREGGFPELWHWFRDLIHVEAQQDSGERRNPRRTP